MGVGWEGEVQVVILGEFKESFSTGVCGEAIPRWMLRIEVPEGEGFPLGLEERLKIGCGEGFVCVDVVDEDATVANCEGFDCCWGVDFEDLLVGAGERQQSTSGVPRFVAGNETGEKGGISVVQASFLDQNNVGSLFSHEFLEFMRVR